MTSYIVHNLHTGEIYNLHHKNLMYHYISKDDNICIGYARKSTINQKSISEQIEEIKKRVSEEGYKFLVVFYYEGSGWNVKSIDGLKGFNDMVKFVKYFRDFNINIYIYDVSRFMRNVLVATKFINDVFDKYNCTIISIIDHKVWDKNSRNRIEFLQELVEAEKFSVHLSDKMKKNVVCRKRLGHHIGGIKYGYERFNDKNIMKLRKNKNEQTILGFIKKKTVGKYNIKKSYYTKICNKLNYHNYLKRGKYWDANMIKYVVKNNLNNVEPCDLDIPTEQLNYWLQCDSCNKWRKLSFDKYCNFKDEMIFICDNTGVLNCNIPEEQENNELYNSISKLTL